MIVTTMGNWNVLLQKLSFERGPRKQHCTIPRDYPPAQTIKWEIQITNVGAQGITEDNNRTQTTSFIPVVAEKDIGTVTGTVEASSAFERKTESLVCPSFSEIREQQSHVSVTNHLDHAITIPQITTFAEFKILTPNQARNIQHMTRSN